MGLSAQNVAIVPTPSGVLDGHFPDGNDGTGAIPLTWTTVPSFLGKQVGTPFSVNVFTLYLTQPGGATATISVGALSGGWTLSGAGLLAYSGVGQGTGTIRVRATLGGATSDSNLFTYESIATVGGADTLAPTAVTGVGLISKTAVQIVMSSDVPADVPTFTIPASGYKETRWFKNGVIDGVTSFAPGLSLRLLKLDVGIGSGRKWFPGSYTAISNSQKNAAGGLPNPSHTWDTGPVCSNTTGIVMRWQWAGLESGAAGGTYTLTGIKNVLKQCRVRGVALFAMVETQTFGGDTCTFATSRSGTGSGTVNSVNGKATNTLPNGPSAFVFYTVDINGKAQNIIQRIGSVAGGVNCTWSPNLPATPAYTDMIANDYASNPLPDYLQQYSEGFVSGIKGGGWQGWRWNVTPSAPGQPTVVDRFQKLCKAIGDANAGDDAPYDTYTFDQHPYFGGLCTQETSNGNPRDPNYSSAAYVSGLKAEEDSIGNGLPSCRHLNFINFGISAAQVQDVVQHGWQYGVIVAGPDLVMNAGGIINNVYPIYTKYHLGTAGAEQSGPGPTGCSIQPAEWAGSTPADHRTIPQLYNYATQTPTPVGGPTSFDDNNAQPLKLDIIIPDWHTPNDPTAWNGATFAPDPSPPPVDTISAVYAMSQHPIPFGTYTPGSGTTGSISQTGTDYTVTSYGLGLGTSTEQWTCANGQVNGNVTVICKMAGLTSPVDTSQAQMGVAIRDASGPSARGVYLVATATQLRSRYRISTSSPIATLVDTAGQGFGVNKWVKINRTTDLWSFFYSTDGNNWTAVGTVTIATGPTVYVQLFASNFAGTGPVTATFQQVNIQQLAKQNYTFVGLTTLTPYTLTAVARDLANNDSAVSTAVVVTTS